MSQAKNIGVHFLNIARNNPDRVAILAEDASISYGQLHGITTSFALHMQQNNVDQKSLVAVHSDDLVVVLGSLFATAILGCRWTRINSFLLQRKALDVTHFLQTTDGIKQLTENAIIIDESWAQPPVGIDPKTQPVFAGYAQETDTWIIAQTSGTTGTPKYVECSQKMMFDRSMAVTDDFIAEHTKSVCAFPITSFPFITRSLAALLNNCTIVQSNNPAFWVRSGVDLVTASPNQITGIFAEIAIKNKISQLHVGGAKLREKDAVELLENFETVVDLYGSTETNRAFKNIKSVDESGEMVNKFKPLETQVEIVDSNDAPVPDGVEGVIRLKNDHMVNNYLGSPEAAKTSFKDGWFYPGDIGSITASGELKVVGRSNDQFNVGGVKLNAVDIDFAMLEVAGVNDAMSFLYAKVGEPEQLLAFLSVDASCVKSDIEALVTEACHRFIGNNAVPNKYLYLTNLPRSVNGKPDRKGCVLAVDRKIYLSDAGI